ncbi:MAG: aldo/keto reductase [Desulfomonile tiedjei]|nr:aldo/keto reductase [Desulfomonile tiedjei]
MRFKTLGATGISVPAIGQGTGGEFAADRSRHAEYVRLLRLGVDLGMSLIDTAEVYAGGYSEELVGEAVRGIRDRVFIATKFSPENSTYDGVLRAAEGSLRRLKTDYIDLYQAHWSNPRVPIEETAKALDRLVEDGKVRHVGVSNFSLSETRRARSTLRRVPLVSMQQEYNILERTAEEAFLPYCREQGLILIAYSPLASGRFPSDERARALSGVAERYDLTMAQLMLNWLVRDPIVVAVTKSTREGHLRENAAAVACEIAPEDLDYISESIRPEILRVPTGLIRVIDDGSRAVYTTLEEALENRHGLTPGPVELAEQITQEEFLKPVKVRWNPETQEYELIDGRVRYWAWVIAHKGQVPIPVRIE